VINLCREFDEEERQTWANLGSAVNSGGGGGDISDRVWNFTFKKAQLHFISSTLR
jgi:hypothetical protein